MYPNLMGERFGRNLRTIRKRNKLTQAELGFRVGRDGSYIGKIERGVHSPPADFIYILADALGVKAEELMR